MTIWSSRLFAPLGIVDAVWEKNPRGVNFGASGLRLTTEDLAKLGQLYLDRGMWEGKRLLTEAWVAEATARHVSNGDDPEDDWAQGYGFQIWRSRHNSYRLDGRYGQFALVLPEQDMVVAITAGVKNNRAVTNFVWQTLLPGVHPSAIAEDPVALQALNDQLEALSVDLPAYAAGDPAAVAEIRGKTITLPYNLVGAASVRLEFSTEAIELHVVRRGGGSETLRAGRRQWLAGETQMWPYEEMKKARTHEPGRLDRRGGPRNSPAMYRNAILPELAI